MSDKKASLLLISVALVWGASGTLMKIGIGDLSPFSLIFFRFGLAFLIMILLFGKRVWPLSRTVLQGSFAMGGAMFLTFAFLLHGLQTTAASTAGFLTGTAVIMVPLIELAVFRQRPQPRVWLAMGTVLAGVALLSLRESLSVGLGEILCLIASAFNASYIVITSRFSKTEDPLSLGVWQLFWAALLGLAAALFTRSATVPSTPAGWVTILGLALFCSAYGYVVQPIAQKHTTAEKTGFILALEPVFSLFFAALLLHESFSVREACGAFLIFISILIVNHQPKHRRNNT